MDVRRRPPAGGRTRIGALMVTVLLLGETGYHRLRGKPYKAPPDALSRALTSTPK